MGDTDLPARLHIRHYRPADADALLALFRRAVRANAPRYYSRAQVEAWAPDGIDHGGWMERRESRPTFVAEIDGTIAGFTDLMDDGQIDMLFVEPRFQGRGVAVALIRRVEAEAHDRALERLTVDASLAARPVFGRCGFTVVMMRAVPVRGEVLTNFRMAKPLAPDRPRPDPESERRDR